MTAWNGLLLTTMIRAIRSTRIGRCICWRREEHDVVVESLNGGQQEDEEADNEVERTGNQQQQPATSRYVGTEMAVCD